MTNHRKEPTLPQNDSPSAQLARAIQLAKAKIEFIWDDTVPAVKGVPMSHTVPESNKPTLEWFVQVIEVVGKIAENAIANFFEDNNHTKYKELKKALDKLNEIKDVLDIFTGKSTHKGLFGALKEAAEAASAELYLAKHTRTISDDLGKFKDLLDSLSNDLSAKADPKLEEYKKLFNTIELDPHAENFQNDDIFAYYRVAGPNPMLITSISELPAKFKVTNEGYQGYMGSDDSLELALADKRLFTLDYKELQTLSDHPGCTDGVPKQLFAPMVLMSLSKGSNALMPVAIQPSQNGSASEVVYAVESSGEAGYWEWQTAKSFVEMAEGNYHELFVHLGRTHLLIESFVVATQRNLAAAHPLNVLLTPHFEGTLFINNLATGSLIAANGPIDQIFAGEISATQLAAGTDRLAYDFYANMLPTDLEARGVNDKTVLPNYPYRDDATQIWNAIYNWVSEYVNIYYIDDNAVQGDTELVAWVADVSIQGKVKGFKDISSTEQLKQVLTMIIFTGSAQHAAVNFPQSSLMTYSPAISGSIWGPKPPQGSDMTQWNEMLTPLNLASQQMNLLLLLGGVYYRMLGNYQTNDVPYPSWFEDSRIVDKGEALDRFKAALDVIESDINNRNKTDKSRRNYSHLLPSKIPMSINI
jgi:arachidonate 15-lipoxygenase